MSKPALKPIAPNLFDTVDRDQTEMPDFYLPAAPEVLIASPDMLRAAGDVPGASDPAGWTHGASGLMKPSRDGRSVLWVQRCGRYWIIERSELDDHGSDETLVFAFVLMPIWTRTCNSAMRLAEHCDPIPRAPLAGYWAELC